MKDIIGTANQIFDGTSEAAGFNVKSLLAGFLGGKLSAVSGQTGAADTPQSDNQPKE